MCWDTCRVHTITLSVDIFITCIKLGRENSHAKMNTILQNSQWKEYNIKQWKLNNQEIYIYSTCNYKIIVSKLNVRYKLHCWEQ